MYRRKGKKRKILKLTQLPPLKCLKCVEVCLMKKKTATISNCCCCFCCCCARPFLALGLIVMRCYVYFVRGCYLLFSTTFNAVFSPSLSLFVLLVQCCFDYGLLFGRSVFYLFACYSFSSSSPSSSFTFFIYLLMFFFKQSGSFSIRYFFMVSVLFFSLFYSYLYWKPKYKCSRYFCVLCNTWGQLAFENIQISNYLNFAIFSAFNICIQPLRQREKNYIEL